LHGAETRTLNADGIWTTCAKKLKEKKNTEIRAVVDVENKICYCRRSILKASVKCQARDCHRESKNGNQKDHEEREEPKKWMDAIRPTTD
jgi:hypothetical protein